MPRHSKWITLQKPIEREGQEPITAVRLRSPTAGECIGLTLTDILRMKVDAMLVLIPKVAEPFLVSDEVAQLDVTDLVSLSGAIVAFLVDPDDELELTADG